MPFKKSAAVVLCASIASLVGAELFLFLSRGPLSLTPQQEREKYIYEDIYKRLFTKVLLENGRKVYRVDNHQIENLSFPVHKDRDTKRIFIIGGSVVQDLRGNASLLSQALEALVPGKKFEVICCGLGAYDSYRESLLQKEILGYKPDLIILMSGNNEFLTPVKVNLFFFRLNRCLLHLRSYRFIHGFIRRYVNPQAVSSEARLANFKKNIEVMVKRAKDKKVPMVLCTLPADLRHTPPLVTLPAWDEKNYFEGWFAFDSGDYVTAVRALQAFLRDNPQDAQAHYLLARCFEARQDYPTAREYYIKAVELDMPQGKRATASRNEAVRRICLSHDLILVDLEKLFMNLSLHRLPDSRLFRDHCHWWPEYNFLVFQEIVNSLDAYGNTHGQPVFSSPWDRKKLNWLQATPFTETPDNEKAFRKAVIAFSLTYYYGERPFLSEPAIAYARQAYEFDASIFQDTARLKERLARSFSATWWTAECASSIDAHWPRFLVHLGESFRRHGLYQESIVFFEQAIALEPKLWFAPLGKALAQYRLGMIAEAQKGFIALKKEFPSVPLIEAFRRKFWM